MTYREYLQSDHWRTLRGKKLASVGSRCETCGGTYKLQVHHRRYRKWFDVGIYDLKVLCDRCHRFEHKLPVEGIPKGLSRSKQRKWLKATQKRHLKNRISRESRRLSKLEQSQAALARNASTPVRRWRSLPQTSPIAQMQESNRLSPGTLDSASEVDRSKGCVPTTLVNQHNDAHAKDPEVTERIGLDRLPEGHSVPPPATG